jgi:hypothetical protein
MRLRIVFISLLISAHAAASTLIFGDQPGSFSVPENTWRDQQKGPASIVLPKHPSGSTIVEVFSLNADAQSDQELVLRTQSGALVFKRIGQNAIALPAQSRAALGKKTRRDIAQSLAPYQQKPAGVGAHFLLAEHSMLPTPRAARAALLASGVQEGSSTGNALTLISDVADYQLRLFARKSAQPLLAIAAGEEFLLLDPDLGWRDVAAERIEGYTPRSLYTPSVASEELILADARRLVWNGVRFSYPAAVHQTADTAKHTSLDASEVSLLKAALTQKHSAALGVDVELDVQVAHTARLNSTRVFAWTRKLRARARDCAAKQVDAAFCSAEWASQQDCGLVMVQPTLSSLASNSAASRAALMKALVDIRPFESSAPRCSAIGALQLVDTDADQRLDVLVLFQGTPHGHALIARGIPSGQLFLDDANTALLNQRLQQANPPQDPAALLAYLRSL